MKLAALLLAVSDEELSRLERELLKVNEAPPRGAVRDMLDGVIRNFKYVREYLFNRRPPAFAMFKALLDASGFELPTDELRGVAWSETRRICDKMDAGGIVTRDEQLRLYRRVLREARRNDLQMDASEAALLSVLRHELGVSQAEHYLIEHHRDLREFWDHGEALTQELFAANAAGLVFSRDGRTVLAEDVAPFVRTELGLEMPTQGARRLLESISNAGLREGLTAVGERAGGGKDELIGRLLDNCVSVARVLRALSLDELRDICRAAGATIGGSKEDLVERIVAHFSEGLDLAVPETPPEPQEVAEPRALDRQRFVALFMSLKGHDLHHILERFPRLRQSGTKRARAETLWDAQKSELTLLDQLMNRDVEAALIRCELKVSGSKRERAERLVDHFRSLPDDALATWLDAQKDDIPADPSVREQEMG